MNSAENNESGFPLVKISGFKCFCLWILFGKEWVIYSNAHFYRDRMFHLARRVYDTNKTNSKEIQSDGELGAMADEIFKK